MGKRFSQMIAAGEVSRTYRDPQEFMFAEEHDAAAEVYSLALWIFYESAGKDYFEVSGMPEDECFMMADPDSDDSVIDEKYIPDEIKDFAGLLVKATVFKRSGRISLNDFLAGLSEHEDQSGVISEKTDKSDSVISEPDSSPESNDQTVTRETETEEIPDVPEVSRQNNFTDAMAASETDADETAGVSETDNENQSSDDRFSVIPDNDYGIILNNKRSGRIEFKPLLFFDGRNESFTVPVENEGEFIIAVSRRHRDNAAYSNPSSVYGDRIIPVGLAKTPSVSGQKIKITLENQNGKLTADFTDLSLSGAESNTRKAEWGV